MPCVAPFRLRRDCRASLPEDAAYLEEPAPAPSLWTQIPRATVPDPAPVTGTGRAHDGYRPPALG